MAKADYFVLLDNVQVPQGGSWANRNRIKTPTGVEYLTLPIHAGRGVTYAGATVAVNEHGLHKMWKTIYHNYARCPHFGCYGPTVKAWLESLANYTLATVNIEFIYTMRLILGIDTKLILASELDVTSQKNQRIIDLCKALGCKTYLSGQGAHSYNDPQMIIDAGIDLIYQEFDLPVYEQPWGAFAPGLSIIDVLFNCGGDVRHLVGGRM